MRGCLCRTLLIGLVQVLPFVVHNGAFRIQNEDIRIIDDSSTERFKPRRWSEARDGPYQMVVSGREGEESQSGGGKLKTGESSTFAPKEPASKKTDKPALSKSDTKEKPTETPDTELSETTTIDKDILLEKFDKVTQRIILKHGRKRSHPPVTESPVSRKQRRHPVAIPVTTPAPHTMSYNLYNHFRPLEQDVPQDHILPFLDFGRKLTTGPPPNAMNSIESLSSTRASVASETRDKEEEDLFHENMDVTVMKKAVERNTVPRGMFQLKDPVISAYFKKRMQAIASKAAECNTTYSTSTVHPLVKKLMEKRMNVTRPTNSSSCETLSLKDLIQPVVNRSSEIGIVSIGVFDSLNKTDLLEHHLDLQSNESRTKSQQVDSPPELKLNATEMFISNSTLPVEITEKYEEPTNASVSGVTNGANNSTTFTKPSPTAKILSTAVVTSVSVKESPNKPILTQASNSSRQGNASLTRQDREKTAGVVDLKPKRNDNSTRITTSLLNQRRENYTLYLNHQIQNKTKILTTLRPKPTFRPVTFRAAFRRNLTKIMPPVIRVASTPHSYIEVPKILANLQEESTTNETSEITLVPAQNSTTNTVAFTTTPKISTETVTSTSTISISTTTTIKSSTKVPITLEPPVQTEAVPQTITRPLEESHVKISVVTQQTYSPSTDTVTEILMKELDPTTEAATTKGNKVSTEMNPLSVTTETPKVLREPKERVTLIEFKSLDSQNDNLPAEIVEELTTDIEFHTEAFTDSSITYPTDSVSEKAFVTEDSNSSTPKNPGFMWVYNKRNWTVTKSLDSVGVVYKDTLGAATYVLAVLGVVPLLLGAFVLVRQLVLKRKKKVLDESEYSSEYNRSPLPTKLPRLPAHLNWEAEKLPAVPTLCKRWEFPREKLRLQTVLGQGNFGQVWKAEADDISGHEGLTRLVAVKTVKEGASLREKEDLLRELGIMQDLGAHPNVVTLLGCCTDKEPYLLIMEYVMYGKMLAFLREHRTRAHYFNFSDLSSALTSRDLTVFAYCVSRGMEYLVTKGIIHRDLAARNILVDHNKLCKIADFGMSRNVRDTGQIYEQRPNRGALPIRWMAPESLQFCLFTHKADVWSFGILLWEIITLGSTPYATMGAREVIRRVKEGYRLERPKHCRQELYKVASKCWNYDPAKRPTFSELRQDIAALLGDKETGGGYVDLEALAEEVNDHHNN